MAVKQIFNPTNCMPTLAEKVILSKTPGVSCLTCDAFPKLKPFATPVIFTWAKSGSGASLRTVAVKVCWLLFLTRLRWCVHDSLPCTNLGAPVTVTVTVVLRVIGSVQLTVASYGPAGTSAVVETVSVLVAIPLAGTVKLLGVNVPVGRGRLSESVTVTVHVTVPVKPLMLVTVIVDVAE